VPEGIDHAFIMVQDVEQALEACRDVPVVTIYSNGFADAGREGMERQARLVLRARALGVRRLGPDSMGVLNLPGRMALRVNAARGAHAAGKPVVAYKLGRSALGEALARSHTGALAGLDAALDAFFRDCGILRVDMLETLVEIAPLVAGRRPPQLGRAPRVAAVTTTGGGAATVADRLGLHGIETAAPASDSPIV